MSPENIIYPLNAMQWETYEEWDQDRAMTEYNTTVAVEMPREKVGADRIAEACRLVIDGQRYLHAHLVEQDGSILICEDWSMANQVRRYTISDAEWHEKKGELIQPFDLFNEPSLRLHVVAADTKTILVVETHHLLFDGIAHKAVWFAVEEALQRKPLHQQGDAAARFNRCEIAAYDSEPYRRARAYYTERFSGLRFADICRDTDSPWGRTLVARPHFPAAAIDAGCRRLGMSFAVVFNAAYALALGRMAGLQRVAFYTVSHGRDRRLGDRVYGNFLACLPILIDTDGQQSIGHLLRQTRSQLFIAMRSKAYPLLHLLRDLGLDDVGTEMSPQGEYIYEYLVVDGVEYPSYHIETDLSLQHLSTCILIRGDRYEVAVDGSDALYSQEQIETLARMIGEYAIKLTTEDETHPVGGLW